MTPAEKIARLTDALDVQTARANRLEAELAAERITTRKLRSELRHADELAEWHAEEDHWNRVAAVEG